MEPLKEMFNTAYYRHLSSEIKKALPSFDQQSFYKEVTSGLAALSLNQRLRNTSEVLRNFLPDDLEKAISVFKTVIKNTRPGYTNLVFPDYVSLYGHGHWDLSMDALKFFTSYGSSEFAIREFLKKDFGRTIRYMNAWSKDKNHHVRRLASEGSRPRLPWSFKLDEVIKDPSRTSLILDNLRSDPELYVRKSVANHLNDISKENPDYMLRTVSSWDQSHPHTAWIIKHASRTLIKKGHAGSLSVFKYEKDPKVKITNFKNFTSSLKLGEKLHFEFEIISEKKKPQKLVVDYLVHYKKQNGALSPKVFKLKDVVLEAGQKYFFSRKQMFKDFTTRKHFKGEHLLEIQVNGKIMHSAPFRLSV